MQHPIPLPHTLTLLQLNGNSIRVVVTSALMTNAAVYHVRMYSMLLRLTVPDRDFCVLQASKTWDEHVRSSGLPDNRETAITLMSVVPD